MIELISEEVPQKQETTHTHTQKKWMQNDTTDVCLGGRSGN